MDRTIKEPTTRQEAIKVLEGYYWMLNQVSDVEATLQTILLTEEEHIEIRRNIAYLKKTWQI